MKVVKVTMPKEDSADEYCHGRFWINGINNLELFVENGNKKYDGALCDDENLQFLFNVSLKTLIIDKNGVHQFSIPKTLSFLKKDEPFIWWLE